MAEFFATVLAKAAVALAEALLARLVWQLFTALSARRGGVAAPAAA